MISKLSISRFKGFEHLELSKLTRITLLGGMNNVGKTTILEALFMFFDRFNPQMILRQFALRGVNVIPMEPESMWAPVFNNYELSKSIVISGLVDRKEEKMTIKFNPNYIASIPADIPKLGERSLQIRTDQKPVPSYALDITYDNKEMKNQTAHLLMSQSGIGIQIDNAKMKKNYQITFIGARGPGNPSEDAVRFGQLDILGMQDKILDLLKIIEPNLKSLSSISMGDTSMVYGDVGLSRKIPISYMGDGVSRLLTIILAIATAKNGIVAIDEFENGIHYSVMSKVWKGIVHAANEFNCQVIATTHSDECLKAAYEGLSGEFEKDLSYTRIDCISHTQTLAKTFDYEMLRVAFETNMEIR